MPIHYKPELTLRQHRKALAHLRELGVWIQWPALLQAVWGLVAPIQSATKPTLLGLSQFFNLLGPVVGHLRGEFGDEVPKLRVLLQGVESVLYTVRCDSARLG